MSPGSPPARATSWSTIRFVHCGERVGRYVGPEVSTFVPRARPGRAGSGYLLDRRTSGQAGRLSNFLTVVFLPNGRGVAQGSPSKGYRPPQWRWPLNTDLGDGLH